MKAKAKKSGSVKIDLAAYEAVLKYCSEKGVKIGFFISQAATEKLEREVKCQK